MSIHGFMTASPKELFHSCGDINPWSKFFKSWRTEAQLGCRKSKEIFYNQHITWRGKNPLAVEIIHLKGADKAFLFPEAISFYKFEFELLKRYDYSLYFKFSNDLFPWRKSKQHMHILFVARQNKEYTLNRNTLYFCTQVLIPRHNVCRQSHGLFCVHVAMETNFCVIKHDYKDILALKQGISLIFFIFWVKEKSWFIRL